MLWPPSLSGGPRDLAGASGTSTTEPCRPEPQSWDKKQSERTADLVYKIHILVDNIYIYIYYMYKYEYIYIFYRHRWLEDECYFGGKMTVFGSSQCQFKVSLVMSCLAACSSSMRRSCVLQWGIERKTDLFTRCSSLGDDLLDDEQLQDCVQNDQNGSWPQVGRIYCTLSLTGSKSYQRKCSPWTWGRPSRRRNGVS